MLLCYGMDLDYQVLADLIRGGSLIRISQIGSLLHASSHIVEYHIVKRLRPETRSMQRNLT